MRRSGAVPGSCALLATCVAAAALEAQRPRLNPIARISGTVFDSVARRPLRGALVQLVSVHDVARGRTATSDSVGTFAFDSIQTGTYLLGFVHPAIDSAGFEPPLARVDVRAAGDVRASLSTRSAATLIERSCGAAAARDSTGIFFGRVRRSATAAAAGANVLVQWHEYTITKGRMEHEVPFIEGKAGDDGSFAICGVPVNGTVMVRASTDSAASGFIDLEVPANGLLHHDIRVGRSTVQTISPAHGSATGDRDSASGPSTIQVLRGAGAMRGSVRARNGAPIAGARLSVWGSGVTTTSSGDGQFAMSSLPVGSHSLDVRALGFLPMRRVVDIGEDGTPSGDVVLDQIGTFLDTVKVSGQNTVLGTGMEGFERRRRSKLGHFMDSRQIRELAPFYVADLFRSFPGVRLRTSDRAGYTVMMRGNGAEGFCSPLVFIDGIQQVDPHGDLEPLVSTNELLGIEVYSKSSVAPPQYQGSETCGSILLWTSGVRKRWKPPVPKLPAQ